MTRRAASIGATALLLVQCNKPAPNAGERSTESASASASSASAIVPASATATAPTSAAPTASSNVVADAGAMTCAPHGVSCVYVKTNSAIQDDTALGKSSRTDLWIHDDHGDRLLARGRPRGQGDDVGFTDVSDPKFSPDGSRLFVTTGGYVVSTAVQEINLRSGNVTFVIDGWIEGFDTTHGALQLLVGRFLLDLDHKGDDPNYGGRTTYRFRVDPTTKKATRL